MDIDKKGGPAFPVDYDHQIFEPKDFDEAKRLMSGMSLRDYFAAKAEVPNEVPVAQAEAILGRKYPAYKPYFESDDAAMETYEIAKMFFALDLDAKLKYMAADAMLRAREA